MQILANVVRAFSLAFFLGDFNESKFILYMDFISDGHNPPYNAHAAL
jgi:hypothetical protein